jgi:hypothetical protein
LYGGRGEECGEKQDTRGVMSASIESYNIYIGRDAAPQASIHSLLPRGCSCLVSRLCSRYDTIETTLVTHSFSISFSVLSISHSQPHSLTIYHHLSSYYHDSANTVSRKPLPSTAARSPQASRGTKPPSTAKPSTAAPTIPAWAASTTSRIPGILDIWIWPNPSTTKDSLQSR